MPAHSQRSQGRAFKTVTGLASSPASRKLSSTVVDIDLCMECCILAAPAAFVYGFCLDESYILSTMPPIAFELALAYVAEHILNLMSVPPLQRSAMS